MQIARSGVFIHDWHSRILRSLHILMLFPIEMAGGFLYGFSPTDDPPTSLFEDFCIRKLDRKLYCEKINFRLQPQVLCFLLIEVRPTV